MADNKKQKKTKNTQEEIEAALAAATGSPIPQVKPVNKPDSNKILHKEPEESWGAKEDPETPEVQLPEDPVELVKDDVNPIAMSQEDFGRKCFNLDIDAKMCHYQSNKSKDTSIDEFLRGINKKIYDETRGGGFSTNIQFRVAPNDYVNVNHIIDWYKSRGFQILNYNMSTTPYGANAGLIEYSFTISWVEA